MRNGNEKLRLVLCVPALLLLSVAVGELFQLTSELDESDSEFAEPRAPTTGTDRNDADPIGSATSADRREASRSVQGTVNVVDSTGSGTHRASGRLQVTWTGQFGAGSLSVWFEKGAFRFATPEPVFSLVIESATVEGEPVRVLLGGVASREEDGSWIVYLAREGLVLLDVRSEVTGVRPPGLELYSGSHESYYSPQYPAFPTPDRDELQRIEIEPEEPLFVRPPEFGSALHVTAEGHCWNALAPADFTSDTVVTLLPAAGSVSIDVIGAPPLANIGVQLRFPRVTSDSRYYVEKRIGESRRIGFDALPPGTYTVTAGLEGGDVAAWHAVETVAGERARVELEWQGGAAAARPVFQVWVDGGDIPTRKRGHSLHLDALEWRAVTALGNGSRLRVPLTEGEAGGAHMLQSERLELPAGSYLAGIETFGYATIVEVPRGEFVIPIAVPAPNQVRLRAVDAVTGERVPIRLVTWGTVDGREMTEWDTPRGFRSRFVPDGTHAVDLDVVPGNNGFAVTTTSHGKVWFETEITRDDRFVEVPVRPKATLRVNLERDGMKLPIDDEWLQRIEIRDVAGEAIRPVHRATMGSGLPGSGDSIGILAFDAEGWIELEAPGTPLAPALAPLELTVAPGREYEVTFTPPEGSAGPGAAGVGESDCRER